ncbi:MAG TPA: hypothetical protein VMU64_02390 [Acidimicrobiales bacterium]|nr:hypothetical protein [Acidimicrobiales bacterium]
MRRIEARTPLIGGAAAFVASAFVLAACSSPNTDAGVIPADSVFSIEVPLDATFATGSAVEAVVPMGRLNDRINTFWQLFFRSTVTSRWALSTPTGVADNGGLVVSTNTSTSTNGHQATMSLAGFEPSQDLDFSPLASSTDQGRTWVPGLLPAGLAAVPDALAVSSSGGLSGGLVALVRDRGGEVLTSTGNTSHWSTLVNRNAIASSAVGRSCGVGDLTAVALDATGGVEVGTSCSASGLVGIFGKAGGTWHLVGPRLSSPSAPAATKVLRLVDVNGVMHGLVALRSKSRTSIVALAGAAGTAGTDGGAWARSVALPIRVGDRVASTGVEPGGGFVVLVSRSNGSLELEAGTGPGGGWQSLPSPPSGTVTVAVTTGGVVDALAVATTRLIDWRLDPAAGTWSKIATVTVPIQFGSSS